MTSVCEPENYRGIPQPVSDFFVRVELHPPLRRARSVDYVKTDRRYLIELRFRSDVDLALFERFIQYTSMRLIEYDPEGRGKVRFFVTDNRIDESVGWDAPWTWANEELPRIGAAIAIHFPQFVLPQCRCVIDLRAANGHIHAMPPPIKAKVVGKVNLPTLTSILQNPSSTELMGFLKKCEEDADFQEAAMYCGQAVDIETENPWACLYRAYEVVADRFGGDKALIASFCSKSQLERFKRTLNHQEAIGAFSRHARLNHQPPSDPIKFEEALEFVLSLVKYWQILPPHSGLENTHLVKGKE